MAAALPFIAVATTLLSAGQRRKAGQVAAKEAELSAQLEETAATQREVDRKDALARALATANAQSGAAGIRAFEGSPLTIIEESIRAEETATDRDAFNTRISALVKRAGGSSALRAGNIGAATSLIKAGSQATALIPE